MVGEGDDVVAGDDVVSGDQGCAVAVRDELSLVGADGADLLDVLDFHVAVAYSCSRVDVSLTWCVENEPVWDCGHHGTAVEDSGGVIRACCDILWVGLSADVVVGQLLVILLGIGGAVLVEGSKFAIEGRGGIA